MVLRWDLQRTVGKNRGMNEQNEYVPALRFKVLTRFYDPVVRFTTWIKQQHPNTKVIGVDADPDILEYARSKASAAAIDVEFLNSNAADLPFESGSVERVVSSLFFHHLRPANKKRVLIEALRILCAGGELHVSDWGAPASILMRALFFPVPDKSTNIAVTTQFSARCACCRQ